MNLKITSDMKIHKRKKNQDELSKYTILFSYQIRQETFYETNIFMNTIIVVKGTF